MDKDKMLRLMRFWLFGTFIIVFAAATIYTGGVVGVGFEIMKELKYWLAMISTAVLCVIAYYVYKGYLARQ